MSLWTLIFFLKIAHHVSAGNKKVDNQWRKNNVKKGNSEECSYPGAGGDANGHSLMPATFREEHFA